jgi:hypothetical protein
LDCSRISKLTVSPRPVSQPTSGRSPVFRRDVGEFLGTRRARAADHAVRGEDVEQHRRGRPGGEHALDPVGHRDLPAGRVGDHALGRDRLRQRNQRCHSAGEPAHRRDLHPHSLI